MIEELPIIQKTYDVVLWYVPILNRLPRDHRFMLGDRMIHGLYEVLELLAQATTLALRRKLLLESCF